MLSAFVASNGSDLEPTVYWFEHSMKKPVVLSAENGALMSGQIFAPEVLPYLKEITANDC